MTTRLRDSLIGFQTGGCLLALCAWACSSSDQAAGAAADAGSDVVNATTGGSQSSGTGGSKASGGRAGSGGRVAAGGGVSSTGGASVGLGGTMTNTGGRTGSGGIGGGGTNSGGATPDAGSTGGAPQNPACTAADGNGFFPDCSACLDPSNCDSIDTGGGARNSCGCSGNSDCPCGLSCGCFEIAPGVNTCGICTR